MKNGITLNDIQQKLNCKMKKPEFLRMIFPEILRQNDNESLLDFIFESDSSYQSKRTYFFKGNMYDSDNTENCRRANQSELNFLTKQFNNTSAFEDMINLISKNFNVSLNHQVFDLINIDMDIYPQNLKEAFRRCQDENNPDKLLALMILWSVYGDWITGISVCYNKNSDIKPDNKFSAYQNIKNYFYENIKNIDEVKEVEMTFLYGLRWIMNNNRFEILQKLFKHKIKVKILISENEVAENFCRHMRNNDKTYISSFMPAYIMWNDLCKKNPGLISVKICPMPILKNYYSFNTNNKSDSSVNVIFYTYGNIYFDKNYFQTFPVSSPFYSLFKNEFNYLWSISKNIEEII